MKFGRIFSDFLEKRCNYSKYLDFNFNFSVIIPDIHLIFDSIFDLISFKFRFNFHIGTTPHHYRKRYRHRGHGAGGRAYPEGSRLSAQVQSTSPTSSSFSSSYVAALRVRGGKPTPCENCHLPRAPTPKDPSE